MGLKKRLAGFLSGPEPEVRPDRDTLQEFVRVLAARFGGDSSVALWRDTPGQSRGPDALLAGLADALRDAPVVVVSVPMHAPMMAGAADPIEASVVFEEWLKGRGLNVAFAGLGIPGPDKVPDVLAVVEGAVESAVERAGERTPETGSPTAPSSFQVGAIMIAYNEEDIIVESVGRLLSQGIGVHLIENWSTDRTFARAGEFAAHPQFTMERFPVEGPSRFYDWQALLGAAETAIQRMRSDWLFFQDVDEIRSSPWLGVGLRDALYRVDRAGFNSVDHTLLEFHPVDDTFPAAGDPAAYLHWFEFGGRKDHFTQIKAWKNAGQSVSLAARAGHDVQFPGRRVFPYKFLSRHYSIRSQRHGERKVADRQARWNPEERARGWHVQYDAVRPGHRFLRKTEGLLHFDENDFYRRYLIQRLSGVGIPRAVRPRIM